MHAHSLAKVKSQTEQCLAVKGQNDLEIKRNTDACLEYSDVPKLQMSDAATEHARTALHHDMHIIACSTTGSQHDALSMMVMTMKTV